jgi:protein SCO1/2
MLNKRIITFTVLGIVAFFGIYYTIAPRYLAPKDNTINATILKPNQPLADFSLIDTNEHTFTKQNLRGHWTLILFGYIDCPEVCPKNLMVLAQAWDIFAKNNYYPVKFIFASIDPNVPTNKNLRDYLHNYNSRFVGILGPMDKMHELTTQLGIYAKREGKIIDHTSSLILIDPQARLKAIITPPFDAQTLAHDLEVLTHETY